jgi:23S rRNA pseudouridine1911/1915/1917 synthase
LLATNKDLTRFSTDDETIGQLAITHYRVVAYLDGATLMQVRLETGRRNQIRVHFAEAGHPVLGDPRYEPELAAHPRWRHERLALHARLLGFEQPITAQPLRFESPLPNEMEQFLKRATRSAP